MSRPSEDELIARYFAPLAGPGGLGLRDDAALTTPRPGRDLVTTKDMLVAGAHFFSDDPPAVIAQKALRVNLSDLAAKGARPIGFLLGLALPPDWTAEWLTAFAAGLAQDVAAFDCPVLGGDTVATPGPLTLSITAFGEVEAGRMVPRTGTRAGDLIFVSGTIGDAALGLAIRKADATDRAWIDALSPAHRDALLERYLRPQPRLALAPTLRHARAAMDISDGFVGDLEKMLKLEGLTATIAASDIPLSDAARAAIAIEPRLLESALTGGDDYEVICTVDPQGAERFITSGGGVAMVGLGACVRGTAPLNLRDEEGRARSFATGRFEHFT